MAGRNRAFGPKLIFVFDNYVLDTGRRELRRGDTVVSVQPQVFDLLEHLIRNRDHVVSRDALLDAIWGGRIVSESTIATRINAARSAIGDDGESQRLIRTLPRKGIRFVGDVREVEKEEQPRARRAADVTSGDAADAKSASTALALPDKPSVAVLPFRNMSGDQEQEYMADGIAEDMITMLSRSSSLFVIARNSSFVYKGRSIDVRRVAHELGVRYVLQGSVRRGGNRVRVTAQLVDAESGNHIWAERYDRNLSDMFALQDEITAVVAGAIEPAVAAVEQQRAVRKAPESLSAWEAYQRGLWHIAHVTAEDNLAAKSFFQRAIALDSGFAAAHARLALVIGNEAITYQERGLADAVREVYLHSRSALSLDGSDALAHSSMAWYWLLRGDHARACTEARQALSFSPNLSLAHWILGVALMFSGHPREGIDAVRQSMRLNPKDPRRFLGWLNIAIGHYLLRDYKSAVDAANEALHLFPDHPLVSRWLAAALAQTGCLDEAALTLQNALAIAPKTFEMYVRQRVPWMRPDDYEHMLDGLKKAGWAADLCE